MSTQHDAAAPRRVRSLARPGLALLTGALAITLAACGGGNTPAASSPATTQAARPSGANTPPGAFGTAAAVSGSTIEVQNQQSGQVTVKFTSSTKFTNSTSATLADVKVGSCVSVAAASGGAQATALTATTVGITAATSKGCAVTGFGGGAGGFGGGGQGGFGGGTRTPNPSRAPRPSGANGPAGGNFGRAFGQVSAVSATGFTVKGVARGSTPAVTTVVTVNSATKYTKSGSATSAALAVGDCVAAIGTADDTGAITARTIGISKPGPSGCTAGFGGRGGGGFRGGGANGSGTPGGGNG
jgi:hypothetical protein